MQIKKITVKNKYKIILVDKECFLRMDYVYCGGSDQIGATDDILSMTMYLNKAFALYLNFLLFFVIFFIV